jgi:hypothetical protein
MKLLIRSVEYEGTPEELTRAGLRELFETHPPEEAQGDPERASHALPDHVQEWLFTSAERGEARDTVEAFLSDVLDWDDVQARRGTGVGERYMRLYRRRTGVGAFAYVHARKIDFRLPASAASHRRFARARDVADRNPYQVRVSDLSSSALEELLELAREAFERAAG